MTSPGSSMGGAGFKSLPALAWVPGSFTINNAVGVSTWTITVPANELWEIQSVLQQFITDANVPLRLPTIAFIANATGSTFGQYWHNVPQGTLLTRNYNFIAGYPQFLDIIAAPNVTVVDPLPNGILMGPGDMIQSVCFNFQAGDQYSVVIANYKKFINPSVRLSFL